MIETRQKQTSHHSTEQCQQSPFSMALHSVHLSFTANLSPLEPKAMGRVERIMIDLLHPNPHVKKLKVLLQIRSCQQQHISLDSFYGHQPSFVLLHFLMRPSVLWMFMTGTL